MCDEGESGHCQQWNSTAKEKICKWHRDAYVHFHGGQSRSRLRAWFWENCSPQAKKKVELPRSCVPLHDRFVLIFRNSVKQNERTRTMELSSHGTTHYLPSHLRRLYRSCSKEKSEHLQGCERFILILREKKKHEEMNREKLEYRDTHHTETFLVSHQCNPHEHA